MHDRFIRSVRRRAKAHYKRWKAHTPPAVMISPNETRSELLDRARRLIEQIRSRGRTSLPAFARWEVLDILGEIATLRAAALTRPPAPSGPEIAWYVSARDGRRSALLYGPLPTQGAALRALPDVRYFVREGNFRDSAFAAFGTATYTGENPPRGSLNDALAARLPTAA
jgi:hypothetical protein